MRWQLQAHVHEGQPLGSRCRHPSSLHSQKDCRHHGRPPSSWWQRRSSCQGNARGQRGTASPKQRRGSNQSGKSQPHTQHQEHLSGPRIYCCWGRQLLVGYLHHPQKLCLALAHSCLTALLGTSQQGRPFALTTAPPPKSQSHPAPTPRASLASASTRRGTWQPLRRGRSSDELIN